MVIRNFHILFIYILFITFASYSVAKSKQLSKSPFIPDDILNKYDDLPKEYKSKICGFKNYKPKKNIINKDLAPKILGYNSRMDNWKIVEGVHSRDVFKEYADAITYASVTENDEVK